MRKTKAFTLVEMLIVMGILIILMTLGIAAGRFAIRRANQVQHQDAVEQLYQGLQAYYVDNREYPATVEGGTAQAWDGFVVSLSTGLLSEYLDNQSFDGGTAATYYYWGNSNGSAMLVCVSLGGADDVQELGGYCTGNGFGLVPTIPTTKEMDHATFDTLVMSNNDFDQNNWNSVDKEFE